MPRSSCHKLSKHSSRGAREYSESEDDLGSKERNGGNEEGGGVRVSKDSVLSEKRKLDGKETRRDGYDGVSGNGGECMGDYGNSSSKKRKDRWSGDGVSDRWNGGGENAEEKGDGLRKARGSDESKSSRRREEGIEEIKKNGGRSEKHGKESSRKEGKEKEIERDGENDRDRFKERNREKDKERDRDRGGKKKGNEGKIEKFIDNEDGRLPSKREIATDLHFRNSEPDDIIERRNRKRNENSSDKYLDEIGDVNSKHAPSVDDVMGDRRKDEKRRDEKYRDRHLDETEKSRLDKYKDDYPVKDRSRGRSREKYTKDDKDHTDVRQKKIKPRFGDRENDFLSSYDHSRHRDRDRGKDGDRAHDGHRKRDQVSGHDRNRNPMSDKESEHDREYDRERERNHVRDPEPDMDHYDERSGRDKPLQGRRTSLNEQDEYGDSKSRGSKALNTDLDKMPLNSSRIEIDGKGDGPRSRVENVDDSPSNRRRVSPIPISYGDDGYRYARSEDLKYRDLQMESRLKANAAKTSERSSKYRSSEKHNKTDDGLVELTSERATTSKSLPMGLTDGSPSPSLDHRYMNRSGSSRSLDVEDVGRRGASADTRDVSVAEGKSGRDLGVEKPTVEESSQADSSFSIRQAQGNMNPLPFFRSGVESPTFMGMLEEDSRPNSNSRYKRTSDPGMGRGHVNPWRGVPGWPSPLPNGFMPFQPRPPHGNFQPNMPHFPSPPIFGFRPPMEINQPGMPFPLADTDRFSGHLHPLGWPNMIDPLGPRLHGSDVNNGVLRGESHLFGADWEQSRHPISAREWESNVDMWKRHNDRSADLPSANNEESTRVQLPAEDSFSGQGIRKSYNGNSHEGSELRGAETRPYLTPGNETTIPSSEGPNDKKHVSTKVKSMENRFSISQFYLSKLDISEELTHPEVYKQCMDLLDGRSGLEVDNDPLALIILMNDRRRGSSAADDALSSYVLPTANDSTFQKALDLYKNKSLEMRDVAMMKIDPLDSMLSTHSIDMNKRAGVPTTNEEKAARDWDGEEGLQSTLSVSDLGKIVDCPNTVEDDTGDESGMESVQSNARVSNTEVVEKQENSRTVHVVHAALVPQATSPEAEAATADQLVAETASETEISGKVGRDSVVGGGQSDAYELVSNESEVVNYGRIHHHSPESTH